MQARLEVCRERYSYYIPYNENQKNILELHILKPLYVLQSEKQR